MKNDFNRGEWRQRFFAIFVTLLHIQKDVIGTFCWFVFTPLPLSPRFQMRGLCTIAMGLSVCLFVCSLVCCLWNSLGGSTWRWAGVYRVVPVNCISHTKLWLDLSEILPDDGPLYDKNPITSYRLPWSCKKTGATEWVAAETPAPSECQRLCDVACCWFPQKG